MASKYEELECLYAAVGKVIYEGLTNYEKATSNTNTTQLFGKIIFCCIPVYLVLADSSFSATLSSQASELVIKMEADDRPSYLG